MANRFETDTAKATYAAGYAEAASKAEAFFGDKPFALVDSSTRPRGLTSCAECRRLSATVRTTWVFEAIEVLGG